jgi:hypothetical protein
MANTTINYETIRQDVIHVMVTIVNEMLPVTSLLNVACVSEDDTAADEESLIPLVAFILDGSTRFQGYPRPFLFSRIGYFGERKHSNLLFIKEEPDGGHGGEGVAPIFPWVQPLVR